MTTGREEALELARDLRIASLRNRVGDDFKFVSCGQLEAFYRLAKQRGAEEQKRKDAEICRSGKCNRPDDHPANFFDGGLEHCAQAIEEQP